MELAGFTAGEWLLLVQYELLLFAGLFFLLGSIDELAVDLAWVWLRLSGRTQTVQITPRHVERPLKGRAAILIPTWQEEDVIGTTIAHALDVWPQSELCLYVGCYRNDPATIAAAVEAAPGDPRLRIIVHDRLGPTTKADCLNRLYQALALDEVRSGEAFRMVLLHDAEDMVDAAALSLADSTLDDADFVQLPVLPEPQAHSRWISGHYCEEFAEAHGKAMVVRDAVGAGLPSAGVGCAVAREQLALLADRRGDGVPFAADSLTEDYELGLGIGHQGGRMRFLRARYEDGRLVATRACFPADIASAVRQKTRWVHGIAFQGWDRLGWSLSPAESWMRLRDRRGPLTALVLAMAYILLVLAVASWIASGLGLAPEIELTPALWWLLLLNFAGLVWRAVFRFAFTAREYGAREGIRAVLRIPIGNIIAIMAGRRALMAYLQTLRGNRPHWDKTSHSAHPAARHQAGALA
ncbi:glycosyl transferase family protein [Parerythrobacter jejuensis]|uniref:Glycosyl transferase family protein n=1 Tax=Parerythrobacter jejuensis TaxID=795812 RepID=A0A845ARK6_9SPHN|nr:glycosyl transferase family protein [Parerythrobacter jejuensis]MXP31545.1 glycosyl transferase family protein [Parerythrobacter jejuensis]